MKKQWNVTDLLRNTRHDWLNTIQLIKGNIELNRLDRVEEIIEKVIQQTRNEAKLSNLCIPALTEELLTFNWNNHSFALETEVIGDQADLSTYQEELTNWTKAFLVHLDKYCSWTVDNHLLVTMQLLEEKRVIFDFHGQLRNISVLQEWINTNGGIMETTKLIEYEISETEVYVVIQLM